MNTFYVTTPIYYPTAHPHVGSLYSTLIADVFSRWQRLKGKEVFFLTGTDEHGQKIQEAACKADKTPQAFVDGFVDAYKQLWQAYTIDYSKFIRTTDQYHIQAVRKWLQRLIDKGDIYKDYYHGWYCVPCETFISHDVNAAQDAAAGKSGPLCESCQRSTNAVSEESYFFRLSSYQQRLLDYYTNHPDFVIPSERLNEVITFVQQGLKDLSISRTSLSWGIPFPADDNHVTYVWADALLNYLTGVGYLQHETLFAHWWPAQAQVMGKDILRFHAVYWPAFLMASGLELPQHLIVHGWITVDKQKMSKSVGNVVDPQALLERYDQDTIRYYLIKEGSLLQDMDFSLTILEQRHNADLAHDLGNLLNRITQLASKHDMTHLVFEYHQSDDQFLKECGALINQACLYMNRYAAHLALAELWRAIGKINAYFHAQQPWQLIRTDKDTCKKVLATSCKALYGVALLCWPVIPKSIERLCMSLGVPLIQYLPNDLSSWLIKTPLAFELSVIDPLFKKIEPETIKSALPNNQPIIEDIDYADFTKVMLIIGTILECHPMPKSEKLYVLQIDCGEYGIRQILSGVQALFSADALINKQVVIVLNLKPRSMMGKQSHGMLLIANNQLVVPAQSVANGTQLR